jgi:protein TonB
MFDSVLERNLPRRQVGRGASLSLGLHAALVVAAVFLSTRPHKKVEKDLRAVTFFNPPPPPPLPPPPSPPPPALAAGDSPRTKIEHKPIAKKPDTVVEAPKKPVDVDVPKPPDMEPEPGGQTGGVSGGAPGGVPGGVVGGVGTGVPAGPLVRSTMAIPFGPGMGDKPRPLRPLAITYSQEAKAARIEGKMLLKCVIGVDGSVSNCRVLKALPMVTKDVLDALYRQKWTPCIFQGSPQAVDLVIPINVVAG